MSTNKNFGIATPRVRILNKLPNIVKEPQKFNFDISAFQWEAINNSTYFPPLFIENVINPEKTFAVCHPSKRKWFVNNMLKHSGGTPKTLPVPTPVPPVDPVTPTTLPDGTIFWTPVGPPPDSSSTTSTISGLGVINSHLDGENELPSYYDRLKITNPDSRMPLLDETILPASVKSFKEYNGPKWVNSTYKEQAQPDDKKILKDWRKFIQKELKTDKLKILPEEPEEPEEQKERVSVLQERIEDGLWWGLESSDFLTEDMPFWITIEIPSDPPPPSKYETFYIISLGISSTSNKDRYDLVLSPTKKPQLVDYYGVRGGGEGDATIRDFDVDSSRLGFDSKKLDIGFMTAGGRLIIFVNDSKLVYSRVFKDGDDGKQGLKEAKIAKGAIRVYGTNTSANIYAYPMTFARQGAMAFPIASKKSVTMFDKTITDPKKERKSKVTDIEYSAADEEGNPSGDPVIVMPTPKSVTSKHMKKWGIDCRFFFDVNKPDGIKVTPDFGLHGKGRAEFFATDIAKSRKKLKATTDFFILFLSCENRTWKGVEIPAGSPYFFALKGVDEEVRDVGKQAVTNATNDVMTVKESVSAPDYFHIKKTATVTLYNENGTYDFLKNKQHGIQIDWSWNNKRGKIENAQTFTGIITGHDSSEIPGKETITLQCEDYHHILQNTPIINSPFYDGMVGYHVIKDLAQRAGIEKDAFVKEWEDDTEYFLPSGYSFSAPKMRFKTRDKLFECIMDIVKRFEAFVYFDGAGKFHIAKLPGGLLGPPADTIVPTAKFSSDPSTLDELIFDQRNINIDFSSTFNQINCLTLERDTRNPIIIGIVAGEGDKLTFKKEYLIDQPAYGEKEVARVHLNELSQRIFFPIRKMGFKTAGDNLVLKALDFVTVDGVPFRVVSISRNFNAESNDYTNEYETEWLNGK